MKKKQRNILIISQYFWPETFRINDLAIELQKKGYQVEVLTGTPNYPTGKIYSGYNFCFNRIQYFNGIKIYRVPIIPRGSGNSVRLILNYLSYVFFSSLFVIFCRRKFDYTFTFAVSPITQAIPAILHKSLYKSKSIIWVQDLWPESISAAGKISNRTILKYIKKLVKFIYLKTDFLLIQSQAFSSHILEICNVAHKIKYLPYWAEDIFLTKKKSADKSISKLVPIGFKIMFAGNIGEAQDFESIIKAAEITKTYSDIKWIIVGDGRKKKWLEDEVISKGLKDSVIILGRFPLETMPDFFYIADIMLLTLKDEQIFSLTIPSKIQSYMAYGKPIISMLNGIGAKIIKDADCGYSIPAGDSEKLAKAAIDAFHESSLALQLKGNNAKRYYDSNFSKELLITRLLNILNS
jgi:glycosyltransferase involved in cell wall biosynthesis